jgi:pimeloyl-ACP methyl ester carboxylesterase
MRGNRKLIPRLLLLAAASLASSSSARSLAMPLPAVDTPVHQVIVIGFVGGFVKHDEPKHAETKFAARLRDRYASAIEAAVFSNYSGRKALHYALHLLDTDHDGILSATERSQARIIIFGHSWGGTQTILLARALERRHIPVLLTIQVDTIIKPGIVSFDIPGNVARAINFYQSGGLLQGRSEIRALDPARTAIIGNVHMTYKDHPVNCNEFPWFTRVFTKSHIEIENDPRVWAEAASLIDAELSGGWPITRAQSVPAP